MKGEHHRGVYWKKAMAAPTNNEGSSKDELKAFRSCTGAQQSGGELLKQVSTSNSPILLRPKGSLQPTTLVELPKNHDLNVGLIKIWGIQGIKMCV